MCFNQDRNIIAFINTHEKIRILSSRCKTKCIFTTQLRSTVEPLRSLPMPFLKLCSLENLVG